MTRHDGHVLDEPGDTGPVADVPGLDHHDALHVLSGYLVGDDSLEFETDEMVAGEGHRQ